MFQENHVRQDDVVVRQHNCLILSFALVLATANVVINRQKKMLWMMMKVMWKKSLAMKMIIRRRFVVSTRWYGHWNQKRCHFTTQYNCLHHC